MHYSLKLELHYSLELDLHCNMKSLHFNKKFLHCNVKLMMMVEQGRFIKMHIRQNVVRKRKKKNCKFMVDPLGNSE